MAIPGLANAVGQRALPEGGKMGQVLGFAGPPRVGARGGMAMADQVVRVIEFYIE
jgi:hypothetical protein